MQNLRSKICDMQGNIKRFAKVLRHYLFRSSERLGDFFRGDEIFYILIVIGLFLMIVTLIAYGFSSFSHINALQKDVDSLENDIRNLEFNQ